MMYYLGVLQWLIAKVGWFFLKTMNVSGAEAVVAAASPFIGQGESACMVKPYVNVSLRFDRVPAFHMLTVRVLRA